MFNGDLEDVLLSDPLLEEEKEETLTFTHSIDENELKKLPEIIEHKEEKEEENFLFGVFLKNKLFARFTKEEDANKVAERKKGTVKKILKG